MNFVKSNIFRKYFVPGIVFQSIVIAGGYGTGREIVEFFLAYGTKGALLSMVLVSLTCWSIICAVTFEFARVFKAYDYRSIMKKLLGKYWFLYEICYLGTLMLVLSVVASSAGTIFHELFNLNYWVGVVLMMSGIVVLVLFGTETIIKFLSYWSFLLYGVYILFLVICFMTIGNIILPSISDGEALSGWAFGGVKYSFYNLGIIPPVLFSVSVCKTRKEAVLSGLIAGVIAISPAIFLLLPMLAYYPEILNETLPINFVLNKLNIPWLQYLFQIVLFGTLIETGAGFIFAVIQRIRGTFIEKDKKIPNWVIPVVTLALAGVGVFITRFGLISLVAKGYGSLTWGFFFTYVLPIMTYGIYLIYKNTKKNKNTLSNK